MPVRGRGIDLDTLYVVRTSITSEVSVTATSSATGNTCISATFSPENPGTFLVEVFVPYLTIGTTNLDVELFDGSTFLASLTGHMAASIPRPGAQLYAIQTFSAASHTLKVTAFVDAGTGKFGANNGATGNAPNATLLVSPT